MAGAKGEHKKRHEEAEKENSERWLLTYADMITLLMLFFIILYSMSSVNPKKYSDLAQALNTIFSGGRPEIFSSDSLSAGQGILVNPGQFPLSKNRSGKKEDIFRQAISVLQPAIRTQKIRVVMNETGVLITLASDLYFEPSSAKIILDAVPTLQTISSLLKNITNDIRIEGHTDEQRMTMTNEVSTDGSLLFRSNWELSAQRAINVLKFLENFGVDEKRLTAVAHGSTRPLESNNNPEGRAYNRRVDILVVQQD